MHFAMLCMRSHHTPHNGGYMPRRQMWETLTGRSTASQSTSYRGSLFFEMVELVLIAIIIAATMALIIFGVMKQPTASASGVTRWEYMTVQYSELDGDMDSNIEPIIMPSHPDFFYLFLICDGKWLDNIDCYEENGIGQGDMLTLVGDAGWELVFFDNTSTQYMYRATFFFKRPKL